MPWLRVPLVLLIGALLAACGGSSTYDLAKTKTCLARGAGVLVASAPKQALAPIKETSGALTVTWTLAPETPPASALILFAESAAAEARMEAGLERYVRRVAGASVTTATVLHRSRNAAWVWIAPRRTAEENALQRCLERSL